jgi:tRNA (cytidine/uridine-2'-O-)-methyltransferase
MHLALYQPQVPGNTGTIGRTCIGLNAELHLIGPVAFDLSEHAVRRAGLDYWPLVRLTVHPSPEDFLAWLGDRQPWLVSKHGRLRYDRATYAADDVLVFGNEVRGIPLAWHRRWPERAIHLPVPGPIRSYNLACSAAAVAIHAAVSCGMCDGWQAPSLPESAE